MDFKKFIGENHPDPDTLLLNNFEQMCILAEKYAESLQLRKTDVSSSFYCFENHRETGKCNKQCKECKKYERTR